MEPFKNRYNKKLLKDFSSILAHKNFNQKQFLATVTKSLDKLEMKDRVDLISDQLHENINLSYKKTIALFTKHLDQIKELDIFWIWPLTQYISKFGLMDTKTSMQGLEEMTKRFTAEFAIRPFIEEHKKLIYTDYINFWVKSDNEHLRRLASEGTRPKLPWGMKVNYINENLKQNITILNKLKNDDSLYVRKSVANHFNDITYKSSELVLENFKKWNLKSEKQKWIIKHALRSLIKKGHSGALALIGFDINPNVEIKKKKISKKEIKDGEDIELSFELKNLDEKPLKLSVDYIVHYPKKNGKTSAKVFKLKDIILDQKLELSKKISFKKVTTRVHYPGAHKIEIKVSNKVFEFKKFTLI